MEAEKRVYVAEQSGCGGSLIKELRLLKNRFSKPSSSALSASDGSLLTTISSKLQRWAEHVASIANCGVGVNQASLINLPVLPLPPLHPPVPPDTDNLCTPLSEEEISAAISQLRGGRVPGLDGITAEIIKLGGLSQ